MSRRKLVIFLRGRTWGKAHVCSRLPNKTCEGLFDDPVISRNLGTEFSQQLQELSSKG